MILDDKPEEIAIAAKRDEVWGSFMMGVSSFDHALTEDHDII